MSINSLCNVVFRARLMPGHIIRIEGYRKSNSRRSTRSAERLAKHVGNLLLANAISEERLEFQITGPYKSFSLFAPHWVTIHLYPRIASLCDKPGAPDLSYEEVMILGSACKSRFENSHDLGIGRIVRSDENQRNFDQLNKTITSAQCKRIFGFDTLRHWVEAGGHHPYYNPKRPLSS